MHNVFDIRKEKNLYFVLPNESSCPVDLFSSKVAVIVSLYYFDLVEFFSEYLEHVPDYIDLYIVSSEEVVLNKVSACLRSKKNIFFLKKENRGRDLSALFVAAHDVFLKYDYVCFVHDKKSIHVSENQRWEIDLWIENLWSNSLNSRGYINNVLQTFQDNENIGLLVPPEPIGDVIWNWYNSKWYCNYDNVKALAGEFGLNCNLDETKAPIALGSVFWCKTKALIKLFGKKWKYEDFPDEPMPVDGTISHALERFLPYVAQDAGFDTGVVMCTTYAEKLINFAQNGMCDCFSILKTFGLNTLEDVKLKITNKDFRISKSESSLCRIIPDNKFEISKICQILKNEGFTEAKDSLDVLPKESFILNQNKFNDLMIHPSSSFFYDFSARNVVINLYLNSFFKMSPSELFKKLETDNTSQFFAVNLPQTGFSDDWDNVSFEGFGIVHNYFYENGRCFVLKKYKDLNINKDLSMYVITHKKLDSNSLPSYYNPIQAGVYFHEALGYLADNTEDNISYLNRHINELTAYYWLWKNEARSKYVGFSHYRRFFRSDLFNENDWIIDSSLLLENLKYNEVIVSNPVHFDTQNVIHQLQGTITPEAFSESYRLILHYLEKQHPDYMDAFNYVMNNTWFFPCNMFVTSKKLFDEYCKWLFSFIIPACKEFDVSKYDKYSCRAIGFFAERMLTVWLMKHNYKVKTLPILEKDLSV